MIVAFGDAVVDLFALPRGADVARAESFAPMQGGAPANVTVVCARLGVPARFVGAVGTDPHGDRMVRALADAGVDVRCIVRLPQRTSVTFVRVALTGERTFLAYRAGSADTQVTAAHLEALPVAPLEGARFLQLSSGSLLVEPVASTTRALVAQARARGVAVSVDLNVRGHLWTDRDRMAAEVRWLASEAAVLKASEEDLDALGLPRTLDALAALHPDALCVLTLAERGAVLRSGGLELAAPAPAVDVVDATGAGDAFAGTLLAALALRPDALAPGADPSALREVLALACGVGARAVTALGATEGVRDLTAERESLLRFAGRGC